MLWNIGAGVKQCLRIQGHMISFMLIQYLVFTVIGKLIKIEEYYMLISS